MLVTKLYSRVVMFDVKTEAFSKEFLEEFKAMSLKFDTIEDHVEHIVSLFINETVTEDNYKTKFVTGYGNLSDYIENVDIGDASIT